MISLVSDVVVKNCRFFALKTVQYIVYLRICIFLLLGSSVFTVAVGNRFQSCDWFEPSDFRAIAHVRGSGTQRVTLSEIVTGNDIVTGRFVGLYLNETGVLQLYDVEVCAASPQPRESSRDHARFSEDVAHLVFKRFHWLATCPSLWLTDFFRDV